MKLKQIYYVILAIVAISMFSTSCLYEEGDWVAENAEIIGKKPVIGAFDKITDGNTFHTGDNIVFVLKYWSDDPISAIKIHHSLNEGDTIEVSSSPYQENYVAQYHMDTLAIDYTAPELDGAYAAVKVIAEVVNENGLNQMKSAGIIVLP